MAIRYAIATGNWSDPLIWNGGTLPTSADDVYANTFTVTIDQDITVLSLQTGTTTGVTVGGLFTCSTSRTITATAAVGIRAGSASSCLSITGGTVNVNANIFGALTGVGYWGLVISGSAAVAVIGSANGQSNGGGIDISGSASLSLTGPTIGGSGVAYSGIRSTTSGAINITGAVTGGSGSGAGGLSHSTTANVITITGTLTGAATGSGFAFNLTTGSIASITGAVLPGSSSTGGINASDGTITIVGEIRAATATPSVLHSGTTAGSYLIISGPLTCSSSSFYFPIYGRRIKIKQNQTNSWIEWRDDSSANGAAVRWSSSDVVGGNPLASNVRLGTIFGKSNEFTGTLAVPPASSVAAGVPVDATVGTAAVKLTDIAAVTGAQIAAIVSRG